ncbi:hypothetical protein EKO04_006894 [Ascochyta lentis]|uniref:Uncharacterized protein n=1 Tax=Ascochyta lentis TaxID=205686 RepID=A0A8H7IY95_9PLEO|nr:hypothetical protein EKO04_006894 [Ascochyta lentis]
MQRPARLLQLKDTAHLHGLWLGRFQPAIHSECKIDIQSAPSTAKGAILFPLDGCTDPQGPPFWPCSAVIALRACTESSFSCPGPVVLHHTLTSGHNAPPPPPKARCCQRPPARRLAKPSPEFPWSLCPLPPARLPSGPLLTCPGPPTHKAQRKAAPRRREGSSSPSGLPLAGSTPLHASTRRQQRPRPRLHGRLARDALVDCHPAAQGVKREKASS